MSLLLNLSIFYLFFGMVNAGVEQINVGLVTIAVLQIVGTLWMPSILFVQN